MIQNALGLIETVGLLTAVEVADVCIKSANVSLIGYELTKGNGMVTIKIEGDVGAVKAAVEASIVAGNKIGKIYSYKVIPRPSTSLEKIVLTKDTVGMEVKKESHKEEIKESEIKETEETIETTKEEINETKQEIIQEDNTEVVDESLKEIFEESTAQQNEEIEKNEQAEQIEMEETKKSTKSKVVKDEEKKTAKPKTAKKKK